MSISLSFDFHLTLLEHKILPNDPLPDVLNFFDNSLKVRGSIVRTGDEDVVAFTRCHWSIEWRDRYESAEYIGKKKIEIMSGKNICLLVMNGAKQLETRRNFLLWPVRLDYRADDGNIDILSTDVVSRRHHGNVDICTVAVIKNHVKLRN